VKLEGISGYFDDFTQKKLPFLLFPFRLDEFCHILVKFSLINLLVCIKFTFEYDKIHLSCEKILGRTQVLNKKILPKQDLNIQKLCFL